MLLEVLRIPAVQAARQSAPWGRTSVPLRSPDVRHRFFFDSEGLFDCVYRKRVCGSRSDQSGCRFLYLISSQRSAVCVSRYEQSRSHL